MYPRPTLPYPHSSVFAWASCLSVSFDQTSLAPHHVRTILSLPAFTHISLSKEFRRGFVLIYSIRVYYFVVISYSFLVVFTQLVKTVKKGQDVADSF